jgi:hypothetical protein
VVLEYLNEIIIYFYEVDFSSNVRPVIPMGYSFGVTGIVTVW